MAYAIVMFLLCKSDVMRSLFTHRRCTSRPQDTSRTKCASRSARNTSFKKHTFGRQKCVFCWRRRGDSNSRAAFTTYTLSRGASSASLSTSPNLKYSYGGEAGIRTLGTFVSLVFKTSSLNRSDTSP